MRFTEAFSNSASNCLNNLRIHTECTSVHLSLKIIQNFSSVMPQNTAQPEDNLQLGDICLDLMF